MGAANVNVLADAHPTQVVDELGRVHRLVRCIGRGGQGAVYEVAGGRLAAKLVTAGVSARADKLRQRLAAVRRLPLENLPIARPMELLAEPQVGYLMPLLKDLTPLRALLRPARGRAVDAAWYTESGGLRGRLRILARLADAFAALHGRALAYGDPSPANILMAAPGPSAASDVVWLIDSDNLAYESSPVAASTVVFTPGYGAPELFSGRAGVSTLTDAHALSVLAYQALVLTHPLLGDLVLEGNPELEDQAYAGLQPWVDHPSDGRNRSSHGINRDTVLSPRLRRMFEAFFGDGLGDPMRRPGTAKLASALHSAFDFTVACGKCVGTYYANVAQCPWCSAARESFVLGRVYRWEPGIVIDVNAPMLQTFVVDRGLPFCITARTAGASWPAAAGVHVALCEKGVDVWANEGVEAWISLADGTRSRALHATPITIPLGPGRSSWFIHTGAVDSAHRVVTLTAMDSQR